MQSKFIKFTTISKREIYVRENKTQRTFTIKTDGGKYKTINLSKEDFKSCQNYTGNDWNQFLKSNDYYKI
jgi:hypothetical protein